MYFELCGNYLCVIRCLKHMFCNIKKKHVITVSVYNAHLEDF